ncbi:hypothetical protein EJ08DRAFT_691815 [Tothia fuscella]|uniref:Uncharacterized protein n=1 Tax=Tothia fuscella TaxID=1048955 RepID=A0A9P4U3A3_9PEZI|nr:hypothetical protein EJ08DRAFT_691815 [Tothia fuscella]
MPRKSYISHPGYGEENPFKRGEQPPSNFGGVTFAPSALPHSNHGEQPATSRGGQLPPGWGPEQRQQVPLHPATQARTMARNMGGVSKQGNNRQQKDAVVVSPAGVGGLENLAAPSTPPGLCKPKLPIRQVNANEHRTPELPTDRKTRNLKELIQDAGPTLYLKLSPRGLPSPNVVPPAPKVVAAAKVVPAIAHSADPVPAVEDGPWQRLRTKNTQAEVVLENQDYKKLRVQAFINTIPTPATMALSQPRVEILRRGPQTSVNNVSSAKDKPCQTPGASNAEKGMKGTSPLSGINTQSSTLQLATDETKNNADLLFIGFDRRFAPDHPIYHSAILNKLRQNFNADLSQSPKDVLEYLRNNKPQAILLMDPIVAEVLHTDCVVVEEKQAMAAVIQYAHGGGIVICMPVKFGERMLWEGFGALFQAFNLDWNICALTEQRVNIKNPGPLRHTNGRVLSYETNAWFLKNVPALEVVYEVIPKEELNSRKEITQNTLESKRGGRFVNVAFGRVGQGAFGYLGDVNTNARGVNDALVWSMINWKKTGLAL